MLAYLCIIIIKNLKTNNDDYEFFSNKILIIIKYIYVLASSSKLFQKSK